ncbi:MAG TPA: hypothetical protein VFC09_02520, partial [Candidatus Dormibacteraeota bacterium]|nr:hypothetical protein [Candidatus Dormibacteraeota bacterium]
SRKDVLRELAKEGPVDLFVGFGADSGQAGVSLTPELLGDLASIPWTVHLDLYPPPPSVSPRIVSGPAATEE